MAFYCIYKSSHMSILPLDALNDRMRDILDAQILVDLVQNANQPTSKEIQELYALFQTLISNKKFTNNDFMMKEDALAVIDLAEACNMFEGKNYTAAGVCYNNIANFQIKNGKFGLAAENFFRAAKIAEVCLGRLPVEAYFSEYDPQFTDISPV